MVTFCLSFAEMAQTFFKVLAPQEALRLLLAVEPVSRERITTVSGRGRVLAEDLYSAVDLPHFHRAAMDGYAVKAKDTFGASQSLPAYLKLAGVVEMGKEAAQPLGGGEAMRISTGGMMPPDSDAVVMVEYTDETNAGLVEIHRSVSPWQNVIQIGDDIKKGEPVFQQGRRLRAHDVGAACRRNRRRPFASIERCHFVETEGRSSGCEHSSIRSLPKHIG